jgi:GTP-binding protein
MQFCVNDGPLVGREGKLVTSRQLRDRLFREMKTNVSIKVEDTDKAGVFNVKARGAMQIAVLVETMRREGFELLVSRPTVIDQGRRRPAPRALRDASGSRCPTNASAPIMQNLANRKGQITNMEKLPHSTMIEATITTRGLIGMEIDVVNATSGRGVISHLFKEYGPGPAKCSRGSPARSSPPRPAKPRPTPRDGPGARQALRRPRRQVYEGMIVGENPRNEDIACQRRPRQAAHQLPLAGRGRRHPASPADQALARARDRVHRRRRVRRGHAEEPAPAQAHPHTGLVASIRSNTTMVT